MLWAVSLSTMKLSPHRLTPNLLSQAICGLVGFGKRLAPLPIQSPTNLTEQLGLHLNAFRGEPAISGFVRHFTSTHSSSNSFATLEGSGLHPILLGLHPGHG